MAVTNDDLEGSIACVRDVATSVGSNVEYPQRQAGDIDHVADSRSACQARDPRGIMGRTDHVAAGGAYEICIAPDVVTVVMGVDDRFQPNARKVVEAFEHGGSLGAVDHERTVLVDDEIGVVVTPNRYLYQLRHRFEDYRTRRIREVA